MTFVKEYARSSVPIEEDFVARIFMTHRVTDYDSWKKIYDEDAERRAGAGLTECGHFHSTDDRNSFLIVWSCEGNREEVQAIAEGMMNDPQLEELMASSGVLEKPTFWVG